MPNHASRAVRLHHRPPSRPDLARIRRSFAGLGAGRLLSLLALLILATSCVSAPTPDDWLAAGNAPFRTHEGTFKAFKTAAAGDESDLGYRCLSSDFRRRNQVGSLVFRELKDRFPWFKYLGRAEVLETNQVSAERVEYLCEIEVLFTTHRFRLGFLREAFFDVYEDDLPIDGDVRPWNELVNPLEFQGTPGLSIWVPVPSGHVAGEVTEIRVGHEWKIDTIEMASTDDSVSL